MLRSRAAVPLFLVAIALGIPQAAAGADRLTPDLRRIEAAPLHVVPELALRKALSAPRRERPLQFAVAVPFALDLSQGVWEALSDGARIWRARLYSPGALSLNLRFANVHLPDGAALWLYDPEGRIIQGPLTQKDVSSDGALWTPLVPGEVTVLELRAPAGRADETRLKLRSVQHGYRSFTESTDEKSGSCNIDVACPQGDAWREDIRAVARITIGGVFACSGQLVNNLRQDLTPYFLTADHCGVGDAEGGPPESVVVYWNYETSQCGGTPDGSLEQNQTGAVFVADDVESDFTLLRLSEQPSPLFNVYYTGWNASGEIPKSGASVHHPSAQEKRISLYDESPSRARANIGGGRVVDTWRVLWAQGTTEPGSSGGGLWDEGRYLVGVLSGGNASCDAPREPDYYARLERAWRANPEPPGQLKAHLDPDGTGCLRMVGRDPEEPPTPVDTSACTPTGDGPERRGSGAGLLLGATSWPLLLIGLFAALRRFRHNLA